WRPVRFSIWSTSLTLSSSTPNSSVAFSRRSQPPVVATRVTRCPALTSASMTTGASSACTTARTIFIVTSCHPRSHLRAPRLPHLAGDDSTGDDEEREYLHGQHDHGTVQPQPAAGGGVGLRGVRHHAGRVS